MEESGSILMQGLERRRVSMGLKEIDGKLGSVV